MTMLLFSSCERIRFDSNSSSTISYTSLKCGIVPCSNDRLPFVDESLLLTEW